jgi:hypothetical protein
MSELRTRSDHVARLCVVVVAAAVLMAGCGGTARDNSASTAAGDSFRAAPQTDPLGEGAKRMRCERVFMGSGPADWRKQSTAVGPIGLAGSGRDFSRMTKERDGLFHTKTPMLVEGHQTVTLLVPPRERGRAALEVDQGGPYERLVFTPCREKPRTIWAAGLVMRDRAPVTLEVRWGDRSAPLRVGHLGAG